MERTIENGTQHPVLVDPGTLAEVLAVSVRTIRRLRARGKIPVIQVTRNRPRFCVPDVIQALTMQDAATDSET